MESKEYKPQLSDSNQTHVSIPDGYTSIAPFAFSGYASLESIVIPDTVTVIGGAAFLGCSSLQSVDIPDSVTQIGPKAFEGCSSLQSIAIPKGVEEIDVATFWKCASLESIVISEGVVSLEDSAFYKCAALKSIAIPKSVVSIGDSAFCKCAALKSVVIPGSVENIGERAFSYCDQLTDVVFSNIDACSDLIVGKEAFCNCSSLQSVALLRKVSEFQQDVFCDCDKLSCMVLFDNVGYFTPSKYHHIEGCDVVVNSSAELVKGAIAEGAIPSLVRMLLYSMNFSLQEVSVPISFHKSYFTNEFDIDHRMLFAQRLDDYIEKNPIVFDAASLSWRLGSNTVRALPLNSVETDLLRNVIPFPGGLDPEAEIEAFSPVKIAAKCKVDLGEKALLVNYLKLALDCESQVYLAAQVVCRLGSARSKFEEIARLVSPEPEFIKRSVEVFYKEKIAVLTDRFTALKSGADPAIPEEVGDKMPPRPDKPRLTLADIPEIEPPDYAKPGPFNKKKIERLNEEIRSKYERAVKEREEKVALAAEEYEKAIQEYERVCREREDLLAPWRDREIATLQQEIASQELMLSPLEEMRIEAEELAAFYGREETAARKELHEAMQIRSDLYSCDAIFPKYRTLPAVASMLEYLEAGRCESLSGVDGAYNLYESELRAELIVSKLDKVLGSLESIKESQCLLYAEIKQTNVNLKQLAGQLKSMEDKMCEIMRDAAKNAKTIADFTGQIAKSSAATAEAARTTVSLVARNNELLNSLGYIVALS